MKDWDEGDHLLLFAAREVVQETLCFSPFELVFGRTIRSPLKLLKEKWLNDEADTNLLDYVSKFKYRLNRASEIAKENLKEYIDRNDDNKAKSVCSVGPSNECSHADNPETEVN